MIIVIAKIKNDTSRINTVHGRLSSCKTCLLLLPEYKVIVKTASDQYSGTDANVWIKIHGKNGVTGMKLDNPGKDDFEAGRLVNPKSFIERIWVKRAFEINC